MRSQSFLPSRKLRLALSLSLTSILLSLVACGANKDSASASASTGSAKPPAEVGVIATTMQAIALQTELPGRVEPLRVAQVRARVNGVVLKRLFREGSEIKQGQSLFQIDAAPYQAALESAQAALSKAQANLTQTSAQAARYKSLIETNVISKQDYINVIAAQKQSEADVAAANAAIQSAKITLAYTNVSAPIAGRIGRALVTEGALVSQTEATQLALIQQMDKVYVNFTQSSNEVQRLRRIASTSKLHATGGEVAVPVTIVLDDGSEFEHKGKLLFSDVTVDPTSGQVMLRAEVPNPDGFLLPGAFVRVRLSQEMLPSGILLPQQAVKRSSQGDSVIVVDASGKPEPRPVKVGAAQANQWVVLDGLKVGEQVIVDGFQKMMVPGAPVKPVPWKAQAQGQGQASAVNAASAAASAASGK